MKFREEKKTTDDGIVIVKQIPIKDSISEKCPVCKKTIKEKDLTRWLAQKTTQKAHKKCVQEKIINPETSDTVNVSDTKSKNRK